MNDTGNGNGHNGTPPTDAPANVKILIEFASGTSDPMVHAENGVTPIQILVAAGILQYMAGKRLDQTIKIQRQAQIAVPGVILPPNLKVN